MLNTDTDDVAVRSLVVRSHEAALRGACARHPRNIGGHPAQRRQPFVPDPSQVIPGVRDPYQGYESCFFFSASRIRRLRCASVVSGRWTRVTSMV